MLLYSEHWHKRHSGNVLALIIFSFDPCTLPGGRCSQRYREARGREVTQTLAGHDSIPSNAKASGGLPKGIGCRRHSMAEAG